MDRLSKELSLSPPSPSLSWTLFLLWTLSRGLPLSLSPSSRTKAVLPSCMAQVDPGVAIRWSQWYEELGNQLFYLAANRQWKINTRSYRRIDSSICWGEDKAGNKPCGSTSNLLIPPRFQWKTQSLELCRHNYCRPISASMNCNPLNLDRREFGVFTTKSPPLLRLFSNTLVPALFKS